MSDGFFLNCMLSEEAVTTAAATAAVAAGPLEDDRCFLRDLLKEVLTRCRGTVWTTLD